MSDWQIQQLSNDELAKVDGGSGSAYDGAISCEKVPDDETFLKYFNGRPRMCPYYEHNGYPGKTYICGSCQYFIKK